MRLGTASVSIEATGLTKYNSDLKKAGKKTDKFGKDTSKSIGKTSSAIKQLGLVAGSVLGAAVLGKLVKDSIVAFKDFETATVDMAKVTTRSLGLIRSEVLSMDSALGTSTDLMKGYYQVISAGVTDPIKSLETLTTASQLAKSAHINQAEAIKGLTKLMAGYEGQIKTTAEAADLLYTIEKEGQTSVLELIPVIGGLAKVSADLKVSTDEMGASLATLSKTAGSTSIAATQYKMILFGLFKPQENMLKIFDALNVSSGKQLVEMNGLAGALKLVKEQAGSLGIGLGKVFESSEALMGISALGAKNWKTYSDSLVEMTKKTGAQQKAWEAWKETIQASFDSLIANFGKLQIKMAATFGADVKKLVDNFSESIKNAADNVEFFTSTLSRLAKIVAVNGALYGALFAYPFVLASIKVAMIAVVQQSSIFMLAWSLAPGVLAKASTSLLAMNTMLWGTSVALTSVVTLVGVLGAAFTGWQIGSWLSDNFETARLAGLAFVDGIMKGWIHLKSGALIAWAGISIGWTKTINGMKILFTEFLDIVSSNIDLLPFMDGMADKIKAYSAEVKKSIQPHETLKKTIEDLNTEKDRQLESHKLIIEAMLKEEGIVKDLASDYHLLYLEIKENNISDFLSQFTNDAEILAKALGSVKTATSGTKDTFKLTFDDIINGGERVVKQHRDMIDGYEFWGNAVQDTNQEVEDSSQQTFSGMSDFYKDALMQMVDSTGSFTDMIIGKMKNLAATIGSTVLTSITGSVLRSIPGVSGMASIIPGLGGDSFGIGTGAKALSGIKGLFSGGLGAPALTGQSASVPILAGMDKLGFSMDSQAGFANFMNGTGGALLGGAGAIAGGYGMYSAYGSGSPVSGALSGAGAAVGTGAAGSALGVASMSAVGGPVGIIIGAIIGAAIGYAGKLSAARKLHRVHRGERYMRLLEKMSFGSEDEPFDINEFGGVEDFLGSTVGGQGISGRFGGEKDIYSVGKYMNVKGDNMNALLKATGKSLEEYQKIVGDVGGASLEAVLAGKNTAKTIDNMATSARGLTEEGEAAVLMFQQLSDNATALQLKDISNAFHEGAINISDYSSQLDLLDMSEQEKLTIKYAESLRLLTDDSIPALTGSLTFARDLLRESAVAMSDLAEQENNLAIKTQIYNSNMGLMESELAFIRDSTTEVNMEMLNLYATMGLLDTQFQLFTQEAAAAAFSSEWFADQADNLRDTLGELEGLLEQTGDLFERLGVEIAGTEIAKYVDGMYDVAAALDSISSIVGAGDSIYESGKGIIDSILNGDATWLEISAYMTTMISDVNDLAFALESLSFIKLAAGFGEIGRWLIVIKAGFDILFGGLDFIKNIGNDLADIFNDLADKFSKFPKLSEMFSNWAEGFGGGTEEQESPTGSVQEWLDAMNPVTMGDFAGALAPSGGMGISDQIESLQNYQEKLIDFGKALEEAGKELPEGWQAAIIENTDKVIADMRTAFAKPFTDLANGIDADIKSILGTTDLGSQIRLATEVFNDPLQTNYTDEDYLTKAQELRSLILERYQLEKSEIESIKSAFENVYDSISSQLLGMQTSSDNPIDIIERLGIQYEAIFGAGGLKELAGSTTGLEQAGYQSQLATALDSYLRLGQEAYQRPSSDYQRVFDLVKAELRMIQDSALNEMSVADTRLVEIQTEAVEGLSNIQNSLRDSVQILDNIGIATMDTAASTAKIVELLENADPPKEINIEINVNGHGNGGPDLINEIDYSLRNGVLRETIKEVSNG